MPERMWYYAISGRQEGPVSESSLRELFQSHRLHPDTMVWREGFKDWTQASFVEGLLANPQHVPVPPPPPIMAQAAIPSGVRYAGFWRRFAAAFVDGIILMVAGFFAGGVFGFIYGVTTGTAEGVTFLSNIMGVVLGWLYSALLESSSRQATPGKMALGIKVTDLNGNPITFGKASGRHFGKLLSSVFFCIGFFMIAFTARKQGLHDMMAGCLVIKNE